jgi:DNA invertase Pin-like site-specific DNA recombinase
MTKTPAPVTFGYCRVSTRSQKLEKQLDALKTAGVPEDRIFSDKVTGRNMDRPGWKGCRKHLQPGNVLIVPALDRLGRSMIEVVQTLNELSDMGVTVMEAGGRLLAGEDADAMQRAMVKIMAALAEMEVDLTAERAAAAREAARERGLQTGRPPAHDAATIAAAVDMRRRGASVAEVIEKYGMNRSSFYRYWKAATAKDEANV